LDSVAWAAAMGGLTVTAASMATGSAAVEAVSYARSLDQAQNVVAAEPAAQLMINNRAALDEMGIDPRLEDQFLGQQQFSPRAKTILVAALAAMTNTTGRESVLHVALEAPDEATAIFYQQLAELLNGYDERVANIISLQQFNRLVIAYDSNATAVIIAPLDYVIWNERAAAAAGEFARTLRLQPRTKKIQLWITGTASPRSRAEAQALGIEIKESVSKQLPLLD